MKPKAPLITLMLLGVSGDTLCDVADLSNTGSDAAPSIQSCIDNAPVGETVVLPAGLYSLGAGLTISASVKLTSVGSEGPCTVDDPTKCAILRALPSFYDPVAILSTSGASSVWLDRIVVDGNRANRLTSVTAEECDQETNNRNAGRNIVYESCENCTVTNSISANTLCASSLIWVGSGGTIVGNTIMNNGDHNTHMMWADGITCLWCDHAVIHDNTFIGNTDIDIVMGSGVSAHVFNNQFSHITNDPDRAAFSAIMTDNFNGNTSGNFTGCVIENNSIDCRSEVGDMCCFGIELGPHPWYQSAPVAGAGFTVQNNAIVAAGVGINCDAAGVADVPVTVQHNSITETPASFTCGSLCPQARPGTVVNVSPDSVVDTSHDNAATEHTTYRC